MEHLLVLLKHLKLMKITSGLKNRAHRFVQVVNKNQPVPLKPLANF